MTDTFIRIYIIEEGGDRYTGINPRRIPRATASVREEACNLPNMEAT